MTNTTEQFKNELTRLINTHSIETLTNIPDHMLADYFCETIDVLATAVKMTNRMVIPGVTQPMSLVEACLNVGIGVHDADMREGPDNSDIDSELLWEEEVIRRDEEEEPHE